MCLIGSLPFFFPQTVLEPKGGVGKSAMPTKSSMVEFDSEAECAYFLMGQGKPLAQPKHSPLERAVPMPLTRVLNLDFPRDGVNQG